MAFLRTVQGPARDNRGAACASPIRAPASYRRDESNLEVKRIGVARLRGSCAGPEGLCNRHAGTTNAVSAAGTHDAPPPARSILRGYQPCADSRRSKVRSSSLRGHGRAGRSTRAPSDPATHDNRLTRHRRAASHARGWFRPRTTTVEHAGRGLTARFSRRIDNRSFWRALTAHKHGRLQSSRRTVTPLPLVLVREIHLREVRSEEQRDRPVERDA